MFLTLTDFECFMGFINQEVLKNVIKYEPFSSKIKNKESIKSVLEELLNLSPDAVQESIDVLFKDNGKLIEQIHPQQSRVELMKKLH